MLGDDAERLRLERYYSSSSSADAGFVLRFGRQPVATDSVDRSVSVIQWRNGTRH